MREPEPFLDIEVDPDQPCLHCAIKALIRGMVKEFELTPKEVLADMLLALCELIKISATPGNSDKLLEESIRGLRARFSELDEPGAQDRIH